MSIESSPSQRPADGGGARRRDGGGVDRSDGGASSGADGGTRRRDGGRGRGRGRRPAPSAGPRRVTRAHLDRLAQARAAVVVPPITYPEQLPVSARREDIARAIAENQVVVVAGETGSGKTTQIPKILLDLGRGRTGQIGHTQPRRIAARSVAERIAEELGTPLGTAVGYQVRFTDQSSEQTLVKVMTDGILLAQIQRDPDLLAYDTIVIDEAHERSLNIDFLLGYLSRLLPRRPDLKLVITSATIDSERFAAHFSPAHLAALGGAPEAVVEVLPDAAPVVEVSGRTYPVEIRYRPLVPDVDPDSGPARKRKAADEEEKDLVTGIIEACDELMRCGPGDILVFLSGEREIHDALDGLEGHLGERTRDNRRPDYVEILPLYSRLSAAEQHRVFSSHPGRRIVLSTNVAETSLTVPGIHYVVDTGLARISRYSKATKVQRLPIEAISQASANQRSGRSGRVADGVAIRLYSQEDYESRPEYTEPEILRTSLASVLLQMIAVGVVGSPDEVAKFPFVEPPDTRAVRDGVVLLRELGALETLTYGDPGASESQVVTRLTAVGRQLAQLPMDPRLARMIVEGARLGVAHEVAVVAAALSVQDVRERPAEVRERADQLHSRFVDPGSDFLGYLNLWEYLRAQQRALSGSAFRRLCKAEHLNFLRVREWQDVVSQLRDMARDLGIDLSPRGRGAAAALVSAPVDDDGAAGGAGGGGNPVAGEHRRVWDAETIHRALLAGLLSQLGMQDTGEIKASSVAHLKGEARARALRQQAKRARNEYLGARGARFAIFPGSPLSKKPPAWIMAGELVETSRLWARDVARIQPEWAEALAGDLARRTYSNPHWSTRQGAAMATEKVLLYGVPIVADRPVLFAKVDAEAARELFIRHALVQGEWTTHHTFFAENRRLLEEAEQVEARSRQRGLVASEDDLFAFYDERVPESIVSAAHFDRWWSKARRETPDLLTFRLEDLVDVDAVDPAQFPSSWTQGELTLPLTYQFRPGQEADGVTVHVPLSVLPRLAPSGFDWMVPGLLDELCVATIRSLPKAVRVQLVPAPDVGAAVAGWLRANTPAWEDMARAGDMAEPFHVSFARAVRALRDVIIPDESWDPERLERLPAHLRMTFRIEDRTEASGPAESAGSARNGRGEDARDGRGEGSRDGRGEGSRDGRGNGTRGAGSDSARDAGGVGARDGSSEGARCGSGGIARDRRGEGSRGGRSDSARGAGSDSARDAGGVGARDGCSEGARCGSGGIARDGRGEGSRDGRGNGTRGAGSDSARDRRSDSARDGRSDSARGGRGDGARDGRGDGARDGRGDGARGGRAGAADAPGRAGRRGRGRGRSAGAASDPVVTVLDESKDLLALQRRLAPRAEAAVRAAVRGAVGIALEEARARTATPTTHPTPSSCAEGAQRPEAQDLATGTYRLGDPAPPLVPRSAQDDGGTGRRGTDAGRQDAGRHDAGRHDAGRHDAGRHDGGRHDGGRQDGGRQDDGGRAAQLVAEQAMLTTWPDSLPGGRLPEQVSTDLGGGAPPHEVSSLRSGTSRGPRFVVRGYPALVAEPGPRQEPTVALRILADAAGRDAAHAAGVRRLLLTETRLAAGRITSRWTGKQALTLAASPYKTTDLLAEALQLAAVNALTSGDTALPPGTPAGPDAARIRDAGSYNAAKAHVRRHLEDETYRVAGHVVAALAAWRTLEGEIRATSSLALLNTLQDLREHAATLIHDGFVTATPPRRLPHLVRYLRAASYRLEKAQTTPHRDAELAWKIRDVEEAYAKARAAYATGPADPARAATLAEVRWLIEELRVSFFAQHLGTDGTVSEKRIRKLLTP